MPARERLACGVRGAIACDVSRRGWHALALACACTWAASLHAADQPRPRTVVVEASPAQALADAVAALRPGDVLVLRPGEYRASIDLRDAPALQGQGDVTIKAAAPGVTVKGSDRVTGWKPLAPGRWELRPWPTEPEQVFVDGRALQQIAGQVFGGFPARPGHELLGMHPKDGGIWPGRVGRSEQDLKDGSFYYDGAAQRLVVQLPRVPTRQQLVAEVSVRTYLFFAHGLHHVHLEGIDFEHANTTRESRSGAVQIDGNDATIRSVRVRDCDGVGISVSGERALVEGNRVERCGQLGMNLRGDHHRVLDNEVVGNNTRGFNKWWEAGGIKFVGDGGVRNSLIRGNRALLNHGDGLWFDWGNAGNTVEHNLAAFNEGFGLHYEASGPARLAHNVSLANGQRGLYTNHSHGLVIEHNLAAFNAMEGIVVMDEGLRDAQRDLEARDNRVSDNIVGYNRGGALVLPADVRGNHSARNLFLERRAGESRFSRGWPSITRWATEGLATWQARSAEEAGSVAVLLPPPASLERALERRSIQTEWRELVRQARQAAPKSAAAQAAGPQAWTPP